MFKDSTGWGVDSTQFVNDDKQKLISVSAALDEEDCPEFRVIRVNKNGDCVKIINVGTISEVIDNDATIGIYKGTGFFNMSMSVVGPLDGFTEPEPSPGTLCRLKFNLLNILAVGVANNVEPVSVGKKKYATSSLFKSKKSDN